MSIPSGLAAQVGVGEESSYGQAASIDRFLEFVSESIVASDERVESAALAAGRRVLRTGRWGPGAKSVEGSLEVELADVGLGVLLKHAIGPADTDEIEAGEAYEHTFTPGDLPDGGLTVEVGRPDSTGTVHAFTYSGVQVSEWSLSCSVGEIAQLSLTLNGQDEAETGSVTTAEYPDLGLFTFVHGAVELAGEEVYVNSVTVTGNNGLATDRHRIGSRVRRKAIETAMREYTAELDADFTGLDLYNRFVSGEEATLTLTFESHRTIGDTEEPYQLQVRANVRTDGTTPTVSGPEEVRQELPVKVIEDTSGLSLRVRYRTSDETP